MHSTLVRAQNVFGFFTSVAFTVAALVALSVVISPQAPVASIDLRNVQVVKGRPHYYSPKKEEYAHIRFDLDADFSSLFNWNTKQLFVYVLATYPSLTPSAPPSQAIIWDLIIPSANQQNPMSPLDFFRQRANRLQVHPKAKTGAAAKKSRPAGWSEDDRPGVISLKNTKPKYQITDISGKLAERGNVTLQVGWNIQPWVGALTWTMPEGTRWARWQGVQGGRSKTFGMPALKGKAKETVVERGTPKPAQATPVLG
ncbi:MAG: hypothetical protein Q9187_007416 [Circinaria calcarea]